MVAVHVVVEDIAGHGITAAVDSSGTIWVVMSPWLTEPYIEFARIMTDLVGCLPDVCTYRHGPVTPPADRLQLAS